MTAELIARAFDHLADALDGTDWTPEVRLDGGHLHLIARRPHAQQDLPLTATALLHTGEVDEFPHLERDRTAAGDLRAYVDALEGRPNAARLGQIPRGRIPELDKAPTRITGGRGQWR